MNKKIKQIIWKLYGLIDESYAFGNGESLGEATRLLEELEEQLTIHDVVGRSKQLVCCENCTHFDKQEKTCVESCVNWSAHNKSN